MFVGLCVKLVELYRALVEQNTSIIEALDSQKAAYDRVTESIQQQVSALRELQALQGASATAYTLSTSERLYQALTGRPQNHQRSKTAATAATTTAAAAMAGSTFVFNSPKAIIPTVAAKLLKQTAQQISMSIK